MFHCSTTSPIRAVAMGENIAARLLLQRRDLGREVAVFLFRGAVATRKPHYFADTLPRRKVA